MGLLFDLIFTLRILKYVSISESLSDVMRLVEIAKGEWGLQLNASMAA